jgi:hypothetical protein
MTPSRPEPVAARRASDEDRENAVAAIRRAAGDGRLSLAELEERLGIAFTAATRADLVAVVADLLPTGHSVFSDPAPVQAVRLAVSHGHVNRFGDWAVPSRIDLFLNHATSALDLRTPALPERGVLICIDARNSSIRLLVDEYTPVDADNLGRHSAKFRDGQAPRTAPGATHRIELTGDAHKSTVKILRPGRRFFR